MKVAVVTPTIGASTLAQCIDSVQNQTYENLTHYIFLDGEEHYEKIHPILYEKSGKKTIQTISLQENVGKGWYGHRVYSACSFLVNADVICYLDEDNWYEPCHVEKIVQTLEKGYDWVYSLRKIYDKEGNFICEDNCESLGKWPVYFNDSVFHIDTSSFGVRRDIAVRIGHAWYGQWGADRQFFGALKNHFTNFGCTNSFTTNYRLDGNQNSVNKEFFEKGNEVMKQKYPSGLPWKRTALVTIGPGISITD
ncbi:MAG: glycosyltransferase family 2 protein [Flavobacteriales bacterium]